MKSGLLAGLYALKALHRRAWRPAASNGSSSSPTPTRRSARRPPRPTSGASPPTSTPRSCSSARGRTATSSRRARGSSTCGCTVHGRAAHAGVEPEKGRSAILEAARIVADLHALNGRWPGVTVNVGVIDGGTRPNVVAERCALEVDVRATVARGARGGRGGDPPDRRGDRGRRTPPSSSRRWPAGGRWRSWSGAGGSSSTPRPSPRRSGSRSTTPRPAAPRTPTRPPAWASRASTDSAPIGGNDHSPAEYLDVDSIVPRTTLLAGLLLAIGRRPGGHRLATDRS